MVSKLFADSNKEGRRGENVQRTGLVGRVLEDNITLLVLVLTERHKNDVTVIDPDLLAKLATDKTEALDTVEALKAGKIVRIFVCFVGGLVRGRATYHGLESAVTQHLDDLSVLCRGTYV